MAMKSDNFGFLMGDPADWGEALKLWTHIRDDVRGMHQALVTNAAGAKRVMNNEARPISASSRRPDAATVSQIVSRPVVQPTSPLKSTLVSKEVLRAAFPETIRRDAKGRFVSNGRAARPKALSCSPDQSRDGSGKFNSNLSRSAVPGKLGAVAASASHALDRAPDVDPGIAAAKELSAIVTPIGRGVGKMFGSGGADKKKMVWIKRLWTELRGLRREETAFNKANLRKLTAIEKKPTTGGAGGLFSFLPKMPKLPALAGIGGMLGKGAKGLAGLGKGLLRRIPVLGGLLAGGSALASMFGEDDPNKTPEENRRDRYTGAGSGIGALVGGGLGLLLGPVGGIVGGMLGDKLGEVMGGWLSTLDWDQIGSTISATWDGAVQKISDGWDAVTGFFKEKFDMAKNAVIAAKDSVVKTVNAVKEKAVEAGNTANNYVQEKTGVDLKTNAQVAAKAVSKAALATAQTVNKNIVKPVSAAAGAVLSYGKERLERSSAPIGRAITNAKDWVLGQTSKRFESGTGGAATISTGRGDHGGASYGTYQLSSKMGTLDKFLSASKYGADFKGMTPGSRHFNAKWKEIAATDTEFGAAQHDFIKNTHYDPQMEMLRKTGIDLSARGAGVHDSVWSTAVQFGGKSKLIQSALQGRDVSTMQDADIVAAIQDYKIANNGRLFKNSSVDVKKSTLERASAEKEKLLALSNLSPTMPTFAASGIAPAVPNLSAILNIPNVATFTKMPDIPEIASISTATQLNSRQAPMNVTVIAPKSDIGQDVRDRGIAHVATGGMSGSRWL
ncbi:VgrG-related protein [Glaciimonas sp. GG7]